ncbi:camp-dependent protein kinase catalytic subunit, putative [Perkinsus marinus ATCC 50983]|uniref:Camp-dependent protein kinase catalytic subunit, putative n=1 Tax=Perkinsus marinus (strain ATCC 50983 / TXsc) TaxID=423536 RepID=C5KLL3_PERM5|nr:camp-dependent protein kinase catalytic subunit, putative [Perkinsus marinus ATCC 50983]EER14630.1 camp-dependent protein kinase catalytic subunit, putative [Perkinsus marinus ATCC 50983]|eukprot:XP_002782834.1 camp-dependent protein kinase catalytic subunit, putative [Perkinsus marinus ATCC 50983]
MGKIVFPRSFDKHAKSLVKKLLTADLAKRYGTLRGGVDDIKKCRWFSSVSWEALYRKEIEAPYKPIVKSDTDTSNFEDYPDSAELAPIVPPDEDPFVLW